MSQSLHRRKYNLTCRLKLRRVLLSLVAVLALSVFLVGGLSFHSSAQANDAREASFEKKADKLLKRVRSAVDEDRNSTLKSSGGTDRSAIKRLSRIVHLKRHADNSVGINVAVTINDDGETELKNAEVRVQPRQFRIHRVAIMHSRKWRKAETIR